MSTVLNNPQFIIKRDKRLAELINNKLEELTAEDFAIGDDVVNIRDYACYNLTTLKKVTLPPQILSIGNSAFQYCSGITELDVSNGSTTIGDSAFDSCTNLQNVKFSKSLISIGREAFNRCSNLKMVVDFKNSNVNSIGYHAFSYSGITGIFYPKNVRLDVSTCYQCSNLKQVYFSYPIVFSNNVFNHCFNVERLEFEEGFTVTGLSTNVNMFSNTTVRKFILPSTFINLTTMFSTTLTISNCILKAPTPPTLSNTNGLSNITKVFIPIASKEQYESETNWSTLIGKYYPLVNTYDDLSSITNYEYACVKGNEEYIIYQYIDGQWFEVAQ